jgi:hypothetical protein
MRAQQSFPRSTAAIALSFLVLMLILVVGTTSRAAMSKPHAPENPPSGQQPKLKIPPLEETAKCKDNSKLYKPCDQVFKEACKKEGDFVCDNPDCSEGSCFLRED